MKASGRLVVTAFAALLTLVPAAGASAGAAPHRRHVEVRRPTAQGVASFGERDGYAVGLVLSEPDYAVLYVETLGTESQILSATAYGAHFKGSLAGGRVTADFGPVGSISLRFRQGPKPTRHYKVSKNCEGARPSTETGTFVGHVALRGEGGYFEVTTSRAGFGELRRTFRERCRVRSHKAPPPTSSLLEAVRPNFSSFFWESGAAGSPAALLAGGKEDGREIFLRAAHVSGAPPGAEVWVSDVEHEGTVPIGRYAWVPESPAGTLLTTLPDEHPAMATLQPAAPFSGEAEYATISPTSHRWTGDLAVQFPGLLLPLTGPRLLTSLCVVSALQSRDCNLIEPDWQGSEE